MIRERQPWKNAGQEADPRREVAAASENPRVEFPTICEQNPNPIVEIGPEGDVRYMNPAALRLFPDLRQRGLAHPWLAPCAATAKEVAAGKSRTAVVEVEFEERAYQLMLCCTAEQGALRIYGIDVTQHHRAEEALRQTRDELQAICDAMVDGLLIADAETRRFVRANPTICIMLGYSQEQLLSKSVMDIHPPDKLPDVLFGFEEIARGRTRVAEAIPVQRADGTVFYADVSTSLLTYRGRLSVLGIFRDITERRRAQETLAKEHRTLKRLLQSSDNERQLIAYEIHDGLAQHLAGALMQFETYDYQKHRDPQLAAEAFGAGMTMLRQAHFEARRLISGLRPPILDEAGVLPALAHLVNEQQRKGGPTIELHGRLGFDRLSPILENAIYRIVQESLQNACQHSRSDRVTVELAQEGETIRIEIRDEGVGFDPESIGERHFGLAGIRERVRLLGGTVTIASSRGQGTRIHVELPLLLPIREDSATPDGEA